MFADLSGFTAMSEQLDPEAATDLIDRWFAVLEAIVIDCGGIVDKYIGDCIVAVWDLTDAGAAARQAGRAACAIRAAVPLLNQAVRSPAPLDVHLGLGSGPLIAGHVGGQMTGTLSVVGEPVVLAERIGELSGPGQIYVDAATREAGADAFVCRALDPVMLPPRVDAVPVFELRGLTDPGADEQAALARSAITRGTAPLFGTEHTARRAARHSERRHATIVFAEVAGFDTVERVMASSASCSSSTATSAPSSRRCTPTAA
jgi:class 3 adenylate cyclase